MKYIYSLHLNKVRMVSFVLAWNMCIAKSDNIVPYMGAASSKWPWLGSRRMTGSIWEPLHGMLQTAPANSIFCFLVSKDFFLFGIYRIKHLHPLMLLLESDYLYKNNSPSQHSPYLIEPPALMMSPEHFGASADTAISRLPVVFRMKTGFRCMDSKAAIDWWYNYLPFNLDQFLGS